MVSSSTADRSPGPARFWRGRIPLGLSTKDGRVIRQLSCRPLPVPVLFGGELAGELTQFAARYDLVSDEACVVVSGRIFPLLVGRDIPVRPYLQPDTQPSRVDTDLMRGAAMFMDCELIAVTFGFRPAWHTSRPVELSHDPFPT